MVSGTLKYTVGLGSGINENEKYAAGHTIWTGESSDTFRFNCGRSCRLGCHYEYTEEQSVFMVRSRVHVRPIVHTVLTQAY